MPAPPFMHGAAHWMAFNAFAGGNTLVLPDIVDRFDAADALSIIERYGVNILLIVGDAFGRPLVDEIATGKYDLSSMLVTVSGGAALSAGIKQALLEAAPSMMVMDGLGASETGSQAAQLAAAGQSTSTGSFTPGPGMCILDQSLSKILEPGHEEMGWLAQAGRVPLGYLGDEAKSARTFPVIDGVRYSVPGDRARVNADGMLELYGRDFGHHQQRRGEDLRRRGGTSPERPPRRVRRGGVWSTQRTVGQRGGAVVQVRDGANPSDDSLLAEAERHIARYKLPKQIVRRPAIQRSPSGKADYRWAKAQAEASQ